MTMPLQDAAHVYDLADEQLIDAEVDSVPQPQPPLAKARRRGSCSGPASS